MAQTTIKRLTAAERKRHYRRLREQFSRVPIASTLGYQIVRLDPGFARLEIQNRNELSQEIGRLHGAIQALLADAAGAYAALTLLPGGRVLTIELKINFLAPAVGPRILADGKILSMGKTLAVSEMLVTDGRRKKIAVAIGTYRIYHKMVFSPGTASPLGFNQEMEEEPWHGSERRRPGISPF